MGERAAQLPVSTTSGLILLNPGVNRAGDRPDMIASALAVSGTNKGVITGGFKLKPLEVVANTPAVALTAETPLARIVTDATHACVVTLPEAADNLGLLVAVEFVTDGGADVQVVRTGADTIDESGDIGNTQWASSTAGHSLVLLAVGVNKWLIVSKIGGTLT